ncbi:MAG: polysaccharide deacetylase family protein [Thermodesulfobacteriota bacterium]
MKTDQKRMRTYWSMPASFILAFVLLPVISCIIPQGGETGREVEVPLSGGVEIFESDRYLVCVSPEESSADELAREYLGDPERAWIIEEANGKRLFPAGDSVVIPLRDENPGGLEKDGYQIVPILCYHRIGRGCDGPLCVEEKEFMRQMAFLDDNGYRVITLSELLDFLFYRKGLPRKTVVITIDDGHRSAYEIAYPVLLDHGFHATLFVSTDNIGTGSGSLSWDLLKEMKMNGFEVGSHTVTHHDLSKALEGETESAYLERVEYELRASKEILDEMLEQDTISIAYPYGKLTPVVLQLCQDLGYRLGVTVYPGGNPFFADPLALSREQVMEGSDVSFQERLKTFEAASLE